MTAPATPTLAASAPRLVLIQGRWLFVHLGQEHDVLSWAVVGGGRRRTRTIAWRGVTSDDLRPPVDPEPWLRAELERAGAAESVGFMTSRRLDACVDVTRWWGEDWARAIATVGLGNALAAGDPPGVAGRIGTINVACIFSAPLTEEALVEALSIAVEARTRAVMEASVPSVRSGARATGTGTDCAVIAAPCTGGRVHAYAGKHTVVGHLIGSAVHGAVLRGAVAWREERRS